MRGDFTVAGVAARALAGVALVLLTFNPSGRSYVHWALADLSTFSALKAVPGAILLCGWVLYVRAAYISLGWLGLLLLSTVFASVVWLLSDLGVLDMHRPDLFGWVALVVLGLILGIGLSWSLVRRRLTGQVDIEEQKG